MTTVSERAAEEGSAPADSPMPEITAESGACARAIVTPPAPPASGPVTDRARVVRQAAGRVTAWLDRPGSLVHAQPSTLAEARVRHHEAAGRHNIWPALRIGRLVYGYLHLLLIKPALNFLEWVTETPLRLAAAVILGAVIWIWS